jgi:hypothetical protein
MLLLLIRRRAPKFCPLGDVAQTGSKVPLVALAVSANIRPPLAQVGPDGSYQAGQQFRELLDVEVAGRLGDHVKTRSVSASPSAARPVQHRGEGIARRPIATAGAVGFRETDKPLTGVA